jgi:hypothetical protein
LDLHQTIRNLKCSTKMAFKYAHLRAHQDRIKSWSQSTLEEQLNVICNKLAKSAVARYLSEQTKLSRPDQFLPLESEAIVLDSVKLTTDVGAEVQLHLGKEEAARFYTNCTVITNGCNTEGLGWSNHRFNQVAWSTLDAVLRTKPDMFQVWLSKQLIGICATRKKLSQIQDLLDDKCPNCLQPQETSQHLNRCPDQGRTLLFKDSISNPGHVWPSGWVVRKVANGPGFEPSTKGGVSSEEPKLVFRIRAYVGATTAWSSSYAASISFHSHIDYNKVLKNLRRTRAGLSFPCSPGIWFRTVPHRPKTGYLRSSQSLDVRTLSPETIARSFNLEKESERAKHLGVTE